MHEEALLLDVTKLNNFNDVRAGLLHSFLLNYGFNFS